MWVGESLYAYPGLLACHGVGLAIVAGIYAMRDLKLLGLFPALDHRVFLDLNRLAITGLAINATSGVLLFSSQAGYLATSIPFLAKIACVAAGMSLAFILQSRLSAGFTREGSIEVIDNTSRLLAAASLATWTGAIVAGRLIAYLV